MSATRYADDWARALTKLRMMENQLQEIGWLFTDQGRLGFIGPVHDALKDLEELLVISERNARKDEEV